MQKIVFFFFFLTQFVFANTSPGLLIPKSAGNNVALSRLHTRLFCRDYSLRSIKWNDAVLPENNSEKDADSPHFAAEVVSKQIIVGGATGALLGLLGGVVGVALVTASQPDDGWAALSGFVIGGYSGLVVGNIGGVYIAGRSQKMHGSLWATVAGGAAGVLSGIGIVSLTGAGFGMFALPLLGATIGFNLSI
ncbi:MAG: hypothetical protein GXO75_16730 [Calditrichaeota bacterium]|nr:hypothetical protein [Calditrichota bacterium]